MGVGGEYMDIKYKVKQVTKLYESCNKCGVPSINCICSEAPRLGTDAKMWILSSKKELIRPTNTARILKLANENSTEIFEWERTKPPEELIKKLQSKEYNVYLLFPTDEESQHRGVEFKKSDKPSAFVIIDGTWQEAKKIFNRSPYLESIPMLSLKIEDKSNFQLRRGIADGGICTIEVAIEVLKLNGEGSEASTLKEYFNIFQQSFKCGASGHKR